MKVFFHINFLSKPFNELVVDEETAGYGSYKNDKENNLGSTLTRFRKQKACNQYENEKQQKDHNHVYQGSTQYKECRIRFFIHRVLPFRTKLLSAAESRRLLLLNQLR